MKYEYRNKKHETCHISDFRFVSCFDILVSDLVKGDAEVG